MGVFFRFIAHVHLHGIQQVPAWHARQHPPSFPPSLSPTIPCSRAWLEACLGRKTVEFLLQVCSQLSRRVNRLEIVLEFPIVALARLATVEETDQAYWASAKEEAPILAVWDEVSEVPFAVGFTGGDGLDVLLTALGGDEARHEDHPRRRLELNSLPCILTLSVGSVTWDMVDGDSPGHNVLEIGEQEPQPFVGIVTIGAAAPVRVECLRAEPSVLYEFGGHFEAESFRL